MSQKEWRTNISPRGNIWPKIIRKDDEEREITGSELSSWIDWIEDGSWPGRSTLQGNKKLLFDWTKIKCPFFSLVVEDTWFKMAAAKDSSSYHHSSTSSSHSSPFSWVQWYLINSPKRFSCSIPPSFIASMIKQIKLSLQQTLQQHQSHLTRNKKQNFYHYLKFCNQSQIPTTKKILFRFRIRLGNYLINHHSFILCIKSSTMASCFPFFQELSSSSSSSSSFSRLILRC